MEKYGKQCSPVSEFDVYGVKSGLEIQSRKTEKKDYPHFLWFNFLMIFFAFFLSKIETLFSIIAKKIPSDMWIDRIRSPFTVGI